MCGLVTEGTTDHWHKMENGPEFCSWECMRDYAEMKMNQEAELKEYEADYWRRVREIAGGRDFT